MSIFLSIQHTYQGIEAALFEKEHLLCSVFDDKKRASKTIIMLLNDLLSAHKVKIQDLAFLAVNQGPGPFTTLRVVIASVNGLSFATKKPLIGVDGLDALVREHANAAYPITVALLNAYSNDVYFAIHQHTTGILEKGYKNISLLLLELHTKYPEQPLYLIGNGAQLHEEEIKRIFAERAIFAQPLPEHCSVKQIGLLGYEYWQEQKHLSYQLSPLYLKSQALGAKDSITSR